MFGPLGAISIILLVGYCVFVAGLMFTYFKRLLNKRKKPKLYLVKNNDRKR